VLELRAGDVASVRGTAVRGADRRHPARVARNDTPDALRRLQALKAEYDAAGVLTAGAVVRTA